MWRLRVRKRFLVDYRPYVGLLVASAGVAASVLVACFYGRRPWGARWPAGETPDMGRHIVSILTTVAPTVCCGIPVYCFFAGNYSIEYVLKQHSNAEGMLGWLFAVRPVGRPRGFAAVLGVAYQRVQLWGMVAIRDLKPAQAGFHGLYGVAAGAGGVRGACCCSRRATCRSRSRCRSTITPRLTDQCRCAHAGHELC